MKSKRTPRSTYVHFWGCFSGITSPSAPTSPATPSIPPPWRRPELINVPITQSSHLRHYKIHVQLNHRSPRERQDSLPLARWRVIAKVVLDFSAREEFQYLLGGQLFKRLVKLTPFVWMSIIIKSHLSSTFNGNRTRIWNALNLSCLYQELL